MELLFSLCFRKCLSDAGSMADAKACLDDALKLPLQCTILLLETLWEEFENVKVGMFNYEYVAKDAKICSLKLTKKLPLLLSIPCVDNNCQASAASFAGEIICQQLFAPYFHFAQPIVS